MDSYPENINEKNSKIRHYQKINILGDTGVGKTSLISFIEKYNDYDFKIVNKSLSQSQVSIESYNNSSSLVEQIKRVEISINENKNLYFNLYETNLDNYDYIKMNLDTLLLQTECIIIMWDISKPDTFDNIPNLISTINAGIKEYKFRDVPIYLIKNKNDLEIRVSQASQKSELENNINNSIEIIKKENKNIIYKEISLLEKDNFYDLILDINRNLDIYKEKQINTNDVVYLVKFNEKAEKLKNKNDNIIKLNFILLGHTAVGKTTFFKYFLGQKNENYISTIGIESITINAEINKEKVNIQLLDTAGQEIYESISKNYIRISNGILLMFDVTNRESFESINKWISNIKDIEDRKNKEIILIGNKIDDTENRVISKKEAKERANTYNIKYFESCCINGINLYEILNEIIFGAYYKYYENEQSISKERNSIKINNINKHIENNSICC